MDIRGFKGAIFDLDGTLVDSAHVWSDIDREFLGKRGFGVPEDYCKAISVLNFRSGAEYTKARFGLEEPIEDIMQEWQDMAQYHYAHLIELIPGAGEYLRELHSQGVRLALATASARALYEPVLRRHGIWDLFTAFATTEECQRGKGFPDVYLLAARRLGLEPGDCAVYEDLPEGVRGAKDGGFWCCAVVGESPAEEYSLADLRVRDFLDI